MKVELTKNNIVVEIGVNLEGLPDPDLIHFHKQTRDILFTDLLRDTLNLSKLEATKARLRIN